MAWYYGTYSCGHEGRVNIIGPMKEREWKKDREFSKLCPDCWKKHLEEKRERENREAAEKAKEMELPELTGTPKQVAWANTIRQKVIEKFEEVTTEKLRLWASSYTKLKGLTIEDMKIILDYIIKNKTKASFYIENRGETAFTLAAAVRDEALKTEEEKVEEKILAEMKLESTVSPEKTVTNSVAEITIKPDKVIVSFEKNEAFRKIVKELGYRWNGSAWEKKISETTGSAEERAAELGNKLLNAGFPICILDEEVRRKAIEGDFDPECHRWIYHRKNTKKLAIGWDGWNDTLYKNAKSLPGARWDSGSMLVGVEHYEVVEEFADLYGFRFTTAARRLIDEYKAAVNKITIVNPVKVEETPQKDGLAEILNRGDDIIDDLRD